MYRPDLPQYTISVQRLPKRKLVGKTESDHVDTVVPAKKRKCTSKSHSHQAPSNTCCIHQLLAPSTAISTEPQRQNLKRACWTRTKHTAESDHVKIPQIQCSLCDVIMQAMFRQQHED